MGHRDRARHCWSIPWFVVPNPVPHRFRPQGRRLGDGELEAPGESWRKRWYPNSSLDDLPWKIPSGNGWWLGVPLWPIGKFPFEHSHGSGCCGCVVFPEIAMLKRVAPVGIQFRVTAPFLSGDSCNTRLITTRWGWKGVSTAIFYEVHRVYEQKYAWEGPPCTMFHYLTSCADHTPTLMFIPERK